MNTSNTYNHDWMVNVLNQMIDRAAAKHNIPIFSLGLIGETNEEAEKNYQQYLNDPDYIASQIIGNHMEQMWHEQEQCV